jgi:putative oxidoreductase
MTQVFNLAKQYGPLIGRILLALIFIISGYSKIGGFQQTAGYMASMGLPMAQVIFLWLIPTTLIFHAYWAADAAQMQSQWGNFMKNLAIMGGMMYVMGFGSGPYSLNRD